MLSAIFIVTMNVLNVIMPNAIMPNAIMSDAIMPSLQTSLLKADPRLHPFFTNKSPF